MLPVGNLPCRFRWKLKTETGNIHTLAHTLEAGASGAMMKTADDAMIVSAIRKVAAGETYISPDVSR